MSEDMRNYRVATNLGAIEDITTIVKVGVYGFLIIMGAAILIPSGLWAYRRIKKSVEKTRGVK